MELQQQAPTWLQLPVFARLQQGRPVYAKNLLAIISADAVYCTASSHTKRSARLVHPVAIGSSKLMLLASSQASSCSSAAFQSAGTSTPHKQRPVPQHHTAAGSITKASRTHSLHTTHCQHTSST
jgi:hypothetical protein